MKKAKSQKAFVQIPILIAVIVSLVVIGGVGTGVVLYKQGKLDSFTANISEAFKKTKEPAIIDPERETDLRKVQIEEEQEVVQRNKALEYPSRECHKCPEPQPCEPKEIIKEVIKEVPVEKIVEKPIIKEVKVIKEVPVEKIVYKEVCSAIQSNPTIEETYNYHDYYPIILSLSDDKGNIIKKSRFNGYQGPSEYVSPTTRTTLKVGDVIELTVEARDPQNRQIWYRWNSNSEYFNWIQSSRHIWGTENNKVRHTIDKKDIQYAGDTLRITAEVKSNKEYLREPKSGYGYDDSISLLYSLSP